MYSKKNKKNLPRYDYFYIPHKNSYEQIYKKTDIYGEIHNYLITHPYYFQLLTYKGINWAWPVPYRAEFGPTHVRSLGLPPKFRLDRTESQAKKLGPDPGGIRTLGGPVSLGSGLGRPEQFFYFYIKIYYFS